MRVRLTSEHKEGKIKEVIERDASPPPLFFQYRLSTPTHVDQKTDPLYLQARNRQNIFAELPTLDFSIMDRYLMNTSQGHLRNSFKTLLFLKNENSQLREAKFRCQLLGPWSLFCPIAHEQKWNNKQVKNQMGYKHFFESLFFLLQTLLGNLIKGWSDFPEKCT